MANLQTFIDAAKALLQAGSLPAEFAPAEADWADFVRAALARYSQDRPRRAHADYAGDGAAYDFTLPAGWDRALSVVEAVEYPHGRREPVYLQRRDWTLYAPGTSAEKLRLLRHTPGAGETARLFYTLPHMADAVSSTVPANDERAVAWLAAAEGCHVLARRFAQTAAPTLSADAVDHQSKAAEYTKLARELERRYHAHAAQAPGASGATLDWDDALSPGRGDYLTHGGPAER
ncbi:MAG: hypothetical protein HYZ11_09885 [Candidatus Tectomicrobia bacterium]|uniref:Uncharacterized protein n=1 Tax=Tectimicrobiota bacterium TaxID=2528274 RepID=A0A932MNS7_UNCTE|nr:hypothetical protein [Candidatus Tectomicrobia bacterium]